jgi:hypothetical protein
MNYLPNFKWIGLLTGVMADDTAVQRTHRSLIIIHVITLVDASPTTAVCKPVDDQILV